MKISVIGTGCFLGEAILACINNLGEKSVIKLEPNKSSEDISSEIIKNLSNAEEEVLLVKDISVKDIYKLLSNCRYSNKTDDFSEVKAFGEEAFLNQLYSLGVSKNIRLINNDYKALRNDLLNEVAKNNQLAQNIRLSALKDKSVTNLLRLIDRLGNEFPNLYNELLLIQ